MKRVALIAALPGELKLLVRGWAHQRRNGIDLWRQTVGPAECVAACAGAGLQAAARAFHEALLTGSVDRVYSVGLAGALRTGLTAGSIHVVSEVIDTVTHERFATGGARLLDAQAQSAGGARPPSALASSPAGARPGGAPAPSDCWLLTHPRVADRAGKEHLAAVFGGDLVDMEAAEIARQAAARGIEFHCVKGISDALTDPLPDLNRFITPAGRFQLGRFVAFAALRPRQWPALIRLGRNSQRASAALALHLRHTLGFER